MGRRSTHGLGASAHARPASLHLPGSGRPQPTPSPTPATTAAPCPRGAGLRLSLWVGSWVLVRVNTHPQSVLVSKGTRPETSNKKQHVQSGEFVEERKSFILIFKPRTPFCTEPHRSRRRVTASWLHPSCDSNCLESHCKRGFQDPLSGPAPHPVKPLFHAHLDVLRTPRWSPGVTSYAKPPRCPSTLSRLQNELPWLVAGTPQSRGCSRLTLCLCGARII